MGISFTYLEEKQTNFFLKHAFEKYVNKEILSQIIKKKQKILLGGEKKELTIFFSDIRDFTSISEKMSPENLGEMLNKYLSFMTNKIILLNGTVDKFIGDAIMAIWNAPVEEKDHALLACRCALDQINSLKEFNKENKFNLQIGIGIHTGEAIIGNFGSNQRFNYTAIGDSVNIASRLEGLTKHYKASIIVSQDTYNLVKDKFSFRKLDIVRVKGKKNPLTIYELVLSPNPNFLKVYHTGFDFYLKKDFKQAIKYFKQAKKINSLDKPTHIFLERCTHYLKNPPTSKWDGIFEMKEK